MLQKKEASPELQLQLQSPKINGGGKALPSTNGPIKKTRVSSKWIFIFFHFFFFK